MSELSYETFKNTPSLTGILPDYLIAQHIGIDPMVDHPVREDEYGQKLAASYGMGHYGYDVRCGYKFKIFTNALCAEVDPAEMDPNAMIDVEVVKSGSLDHKWVDSGREGWLVCLLCDQCVSDVRFAKKACPASPGLRPTFIRIPPNSFALAESIETLTIPRDIMVVCIGKSTYARTGIIVNVTPLEPEWTGKITIEISNTTPVPARIYAGQGILQLLFFRGAAPCRHSYADKKGKYQNQTGLTLPKV